MNRQWSLIATMTGLAYAAAGCSVGEAGPSAVPAANSPAPLPVMVTTPEITDLVATYATTATIGADSDASIPARVTGEVVDILVEEGDAVREGQVLARLDGDRLRLAMEQARAELDQAKRELERLENLHERGLVSAAMFDGLRYQVESLEATWKLRRLEYGYSEIRATIAGVVAERHIKVGAQLTPGMPAFRIADTSELIAYLEIPQTELGKFEAGHRANMRVDSMPGAGFDATIERLSPTIDPETGTFRATAYIDNSDGLLAPGMFGRFSIAYERHADALVIPAAAAVQEDGVTVVYVVRDGSAVRRVIETGLRAGDRIEVLAGLDRDDQVVVTGQSSLRDGSPVLASAGLPATYSG